MKRLAIFVSTIAIIASLASGCSNSSVGKLAGANGVSVAAENQNEIKSQVNIEEVSKVTEDKEATKVEDKKENESNITEDKIPTNNKEKELTEIEEKENSVGEIRIYRQF